MFFIREFREFREFRERQCSTVGLIPKLPKHYQREFREFREFKERQCSTVGLIPKLPKLLKLPSQHTTPNAPLTNKNTKTQKHTR